MKTEIAVNTNFENKPVQNIQLPMSRKLLEIFLWLSQKCIVNRISPYWNLVKIEYSVFSGAARHRGAAWTIESIPYLMNSYAFEQSDSTD